MDQVAASGMVTELARQIVDLAKGTAWPIAVLAICILLRRQIPDLISRVREAEALGAKVRLDAPSQQSAAGAPEGGLHLEDLDEPIREPYDSPGSADASAKRSIEEGATSLEPSVHRPGEELEQLRATAQHLRYQLWSERMHRVIFGSQLELLAHLEAGQRAANEHEVRNFYSEYVDRARAVGIPPADFANWVGFLLRWTVLEVTDSGYRLTPNGHWFLRYVRENQLGQRIL